MSATRSTGGLIRYFLYLGSLGFGGPVALLGYMQRDLVERRRWFTREEYLKGLALSQLAICLGYTHGQVWGATVVGAAFVLPSFLNMEITHEPASTHPLRLSSRSRQERPRRGRL